MSDTTFKWNGSLVETELSYVWFNMPDGSKHGWPQVDMHEAERLAMFLNAHVVDITRLSSEAAALRADLARVTGEMDNEKARRVYYQSIVYDVCNTLDIAAKRSVSRGQGIVCGTLDEPHDDVQRDVKALVAQRDAALAEVGRVKDRLRHRSEMLDLADALAIAAKDMLTGVSVHNERIRPGSEATPIQGPVVEALSDALHAYRIESNKHFTKDNADFAALTPPAPQQEKPRED